MGNGGSLDAERVRELLSRLTCPLCGGTRDGSLLVVVDHPATGAAVRAQCVRCHVFWSFTIDAELGLTAPVATRSRAAPAEPITVDELLDVHRLLESHRGELRDLLWRRAG